MFPSEYPATVFHWNGHRRDVQSADELAALPPGYYFALDELEKAVATMGLPWHPQRGPFAPLSAQGTSDNHPPRGPLCVCAVRGLVYNTRARVPGEVFLLEGRPEDYTHRDAGAIRDYPRGAQRRYMHPETGRWLTDQTTLEFYAQCLDRDDITTLGFVTPHPGRSTVGHPLDAEWRSWSLEYLTDLLKEGVRRAKVRYPDKKRLSFDNVAECVGYTRKFLTLALDNHHLHWTMIRATLGA